MSIGKVGRGIDVHLLLVSLILLSIASLNNPIQVHAVAPSIVLSSNYAIRGVAVSLSGSNFNTSDTSCKVFSTDRFNNTAMGEVAVNTSCSISAGAVFGSFNVNQSLVARNPYTIFVVGYNGLKAVDRAQATFSIIGLTLVPVSASLGATVNFNGSLVASDTSCAVSGSVVVSPVCTMSAGGNFTGSLTVSTLSPTGAQTIQVTGSPSSVFVQASLTVYGALITLKPASGRVGTVVQISGSGFSTGDSSCTISSPTLSGMVLNATCAMSGGSVRAGSNFTVGTVLPGAYVIRVSGSAGDFAEATFQVVVSASITLNPSGGKLGAFVQVSGSGFLPGDSSCAISSSGNITFTACSMIAGSGAPTGNFTVGNAPAGSYLITVTGGGGDSAQAPFQETSGAVKLTLNPVNASAGSIVTITGSSFSTLDTSCVVSSTQTGLLVSSYTCFISSGVVTGSFVVGANATAEVKWNVTVVGLPFNDSATAGFHVVPKITLSPSAGTLDAVITVAGSGFNSSARKCTLSVLPNGTVPNAYFDSISCVLAGSSGRASGSFVVRNAPLGIYSVNLTDNSSPRKFSAASSFTVGTATTTSGTTSAPATVTVTTSRLLTTTTTSTTTSKVTTVARSPCLIATASFGSELAPEVQLLRDFRDQQILNTAAGSSFMVAFNAWYYSFSPSVAGYLSTHTFERTVMKGVLYPLVGILKLSSMTFTATSAFPELAALLSGLIASSLVGAFYLGLPLSLIRAKVRRLRDSNAQAGLEKILAGGLLLGIALLLVGEVLAMGAVLTMASCAIVLSALFLSATFTSGRIAWKFHSP